MSRSGYSDDCENIWLYRRTVENALGGKRGQAFLRELVESLDALPEHCLIAEELIRTEADEQATPAPPRAIGVCAIGAIGVARGMDMHTLDAGDRRAMGKAFGIAGCMVAEIEYENDEMRVRETDEDRWLRMRNWALSNIEGPV